MSTITMPALSPTMTEGKLARWLVKEGDDVRSGDVIAEIETDKALMEVEALEDGTVSRLMVAEGEDAVAVGAPIAEINGDGSEVAGEAPSTPAAQTPATTPAQTQPAAAPPAPVAAVAAEKAHSGNMINITIREALRDAMADCLYHG